MSNTQCALIVDRDADTREMYAEFLGHSGYDIEMADDGRQALAIALTCLPTIIIMETWLPGLSGFELCRVLRHDPSTRAIPIVVVTANVFPSDVGLAEIAGADAVLIKPCLPERLMAEIDRLLAPVPALREGLREVHLRPAAHATRVSRMIDRASENQRPVALNRGHQRRATTDPPKAPPALMCPGCDRPMHYLSSRIGGVSERNPEQWDYFECAICRRSFEYRQRTRKLKPYPFDIPA